MDLLIELQAIPGPSGDEGAIADRVEDLCREVPDTTVTRICDSVFVVRGKPRVAVFAHTDTVGFTLAYDRLLYPLGGPAPSGGELLRVVGGKATARLKVRAKGDRPTWHLTGKKGEPGSRWVYANPLRVKKDKISGPYLDNRAGVWNALETLRRCEDVAVLFTAGEEQSGRGAFVGARFAFQELGVTRALISDITWHTEHIRNGKGPAISLRDRLPPRQRFLDEVLSRAMGIGIPFQREVERDGGSDGHSIERSGLPIDWVFIGAPQKDSHTDHEECSIPDLHAMAELYACLVPALSR